GGVHQTLSHRSNRIAGKWVDAVDDTVIQCARKCRLNLCQHFLNHTNLVILISPLNFLSEADSLLELERVNSLGSRGDGGRRLVSTFANILSFTRVEDERFARPELHRGRA